MLNYALFENCSTFKFFAYKVVESYFLFAKVDSFASLSILTLNQYFDLLLLDCKLLQGLREQKWAFNQEKFANKFLLSFSGLHCNPLSPKLLIVVHFELNAESQDICF